MPVGELHQIEKSVFIRAPRSRVWRALTDSREFGRWFGVEVSGPFQTGQRVQMSSTAEKHKGVQFFVEVGEMIPERTFAWRWHPGMPDPAVDYSREPATTVEFRLEDAEGGTKLSVKESGFDRISLTRRAAVFADNEKGWTHQMKAISDYVHDTP